MTFSWRSEPEVITILTFDWLKSKTRIVSIATSCDNHKILYRQVFNFFFSRPGRFSGQLVVLPFLIHIILISILVVVCFSFSPLCFFCFFFCNVFFYACVSGYLIISTMFCLFRMTHLLRLAVLASFLSIYYFFFVCFFFCVILRI